jgi:predicted O-methyltransferase YrrM
MTFERAMELWREFDSQTERTVVEELYHAVLNSPAGDVVEVGSAAGGTTIVLVAAAEKAGKRVFSIDPYDEGLEGVANHYYKGSMSALRNGFLKNMAGYPVTQFVSDVFSCHSKLPYELSVIFIDGCHELSMVQRDFNLLLPRLVPGGYIFCHDIDWQVGQFSNTKEGGLCHFPEWVDKSLFSAIGQVSNTWKGIKK